jgi:hypothetical protein
VSNESRFFDSADSTGRRLRKQVSMQSVKDTDLQELQGPDLENPLHADARLERHYIWQRSWERAAMRMSHRDFVQAKQMKMDKYEKFVELAYMVIQVNIRRAIMAKSRFTSYV